MTLGDDILVEQAIAVGIPIEMDWKAPRLTYAQAETLHDLVSWWQNEIPFLPTDAFPSRNNADNGKRCCVRALANKGLFTPTPHQPGYYTPDKARCEAAWMAWREKNLDWETF